jgi:CubicO group peptidase (beta-lactamase class C family)
MRDPLYLPLQALLGLSLLAMPAMLPRLCLAHELARAQGGSDEATGPLVQAPQIGYALFDPVLTRRRGLTQIAVEGCAEQEIPEAFRSYGQAEISDQEHAAVTNGEEVFEIASISKSFAGILLAKLGPQAAQQKVSQFLPELAGSPFANVTLEALARHESGLPTEMPSKGPYSNLNPWQSLKESELLDYVTHGAPAPDKLPGFPPGQDHYKKRYSDLGIAVLGAALVRAYAGPPYAADAKPRLDYAALAEAQIFSKLQMKQTKPLGPLHASREAVPGYRRDVHEDGSVSYHRKPAWAWDALGPAGGYGSTILDMKKYLRAATCPDTVSDPELRLALTASIQQRYGWDHDAGATWGIKYGESEAHSSVIRF